MVDPEIVANLFARLEEEVKHLRRLAQGDTEALLTDRDALAAAKYGLVVAIEICIDVGQHVIASEQLRPPASFADVFTVLGESEFVPTGMVTTLRDMAGFRNVLVHAYLEVDDRKVVEFLKSRLGDFDAFRAAVARAALEEHGS